MPDHSFPAEAGRSDAAWAEGPASVAASDPSASGPGGTGAGAPAGGVVAPAGPEAHLRHFADKAPLALLKLDETGTIGCANAAARQYAAGADGLAGRRWHDTFGGGKAAEDWAWLVAREGEARDVGFTARDGTPRAIEWRFFPLRDGAGAVVEILAYGLDITERVQRAEELRRSQEHLLRAQRIARVGSVELDLATSAMRFSEEAYRIFAIDPSTEELTLELAIGRIVPEDRERVRANLAAAREGIAAPIEYRLNLPDGAIRNIYREDEIVVDAEGRPVTMIGTFKDITELRESEARLRRSQQHLALAQRIAAIGSFELDLQTLALEGSDESFRIFGIERQEAGLRHNALVEQILPEDRERVRANLVAARYGVAASIEYRIRRSDGAIRHIYREGEIVRDAGGGARKLVGILRDVTSAREAERRQEELKTQLQHAQRLDSLGTLASGIAHDLNNTLVPIVGLTRLMLKRAAPDSRDRKNLEIVQIAGERARRLVRQVLQFCRAEAAEKQSVDLAAQLRDLLAMMRATLPATIVLESRIPALPDIWGDPGQLYQVFLNMITNAAHAIGDRPGRIVVEAAPEEGAPPFVRVSVIDDGCGIAPAIKDKIFDPFFTTKDISAGTGLGLSVVHGIVANHGGRIAVESEEGVGSRFDVYLPAVADHVDRIALAQR